MKKNRCIALCLVLALVFSMTACTTARENIEKYFSEVNGKLKILTGASASDKKTVDNSKSALPTPANFTLAEDGTYSFGAVEGADNYVVYMYDAATGEGRFNSLPTTVTSGNLRDLIDYAYGIYDVQVVAYPAATDKTYKKSEPAHVSFTCKGEVPAPEYAYRWDCFTKEFGVQLINVTTYNASAFPKKTDITLTGADGSEVKLSMENISLADNVFTVTAENLPAGSYSLTVETVWDEAVVTNSKLESDLGTIELLDNANAMTEGYGYLNTEVYTTLDYPTVADFDPQQGGSIGTWYYFENWKMSYKGVVSVATFGERGVEDVAYTAVPMENVTEGSVYSFDIELQNASGKISLYDGFFYHDQNKGYGTLELKADGTFVLEILGSVQEESAQGGGMGFGGRGGVPHGSIQGTWLENGDGTVKLSYNRSSAVSDSTGAH